MQLSAVRRGNIPLATTDHLLVCNWNRQAPLLLRQMATNGHGDSKRLGRQAGGRCEVIGGMVWGVAVPGRAVEGQINRRGPVCCILAGLHAGLQACCACCPHL